MADAREQFVVLFQVNLLAERGNVIRKGVVHWHLLWRCHLLDDYWERVSETADGFEIASLTLVARSELFQIAFWEQHYTSKSGDGEVCSS